MIPREMLGSTPRKVAARAATEARRARLRRRRRSIGGQLLPVAEQRVLTDVDRLLTAMPTAAVAVLAGGAPSGLVGVLTQGHPHARIDEIPVAAGPPSLHARLAAGGPYRLIVVSAAAAEESDLAALYGSVLFHLTAGGRLLVADFHPGRPAPQGLWPLVHRLIALRDDALEPRDADERALAGATRQLTVTGRRLAVTNGTAALAKLRESEVDFVLEQRGPRAGQVLEHIEAEWFEVDVVVRDHAVDTKTRALKPMGVPRLSLRRYNDAYCVPRQITVLDNLLLPDTYRHHPRSRLVTSGTTEVSPTFARVDTDLKRARPIEGSVFQLDSEWSGHFGHLMTEQMSRLWAWPSAKQRFPELRPVLFKQRWTQPPSPWESGLLEAAGIDPADVLVIAGPIRAERVIAATPMFSMPYYVSPRIAGVWDTVGRGAHALAGAVPTPRRIFVSRRQAGRHVHNRDEVEATFTEAGFAVVYPEDRPFAEQVALFRNAEVIAGFAGSAMFTLALCDVPKRVLLVCSEGYTPHNEYMITSVRRHDVDIFWSVPDSTRINAAFTFDFQREGRHLRRVLDGLTATPEPSQDAGRGARPG